ncbi:MAG TPA: pyridoxal-dependent decarboxylase [Bryobacteraceae bacterium]|jgi:aromatic-L-amino-acid decarboxylase|nr:pyridoxal-dependent decarboxylase [Bryobacteraceae bacterium]
MSDMPVEEFRRRGRELVDWIADYLANIRDYPVLPDLRPGELIDELPRSGPETGEGMEAILADFQRCVLPAVTHWNHPRFFAYFACSSSGPAILAEMIAAALDSNGILWKTSPAVTELELATLGWLRQWLGFSDEWFGVMYDTASVSSLHAIAAAREAKFPEARTEGGLRDATLYASEHSHSSIEKGAIALGIGQRNVRKIAVDAEFRMRPDALRAAIERDIAAGKAPFCVVATVGTTSTTSIDPVREIAEIAGRYGLWLHVDAAYAGAAAIVPEFRYILDGCDQADSFVTNPHKWLFVPVDLSAFYTRRPDILRRAFSLVPEYLRTIDDPRVVNLMDYGIPLGRRFRALKLWFVMRYFGREGLCALLREHVRLAQEFAAWVGRDPDFEIAAPHPLSVVCFRLKAGDEANRELMDAVNATGEAFLSHTVLNGRFTLRFAVGNIRTGIEDVKAAWDLIRGSAWRGRGAF